MTSLCTELLKRKQNADLTGNGINPPNDFDHRIYASEIAALLIKQSPRAAPVSAANGT
ncbi:hypothetical protein K239x_16010 [Planctomycetes bacterium K23_9]|uniref:Uncharacterized protein n=1 Tax=Stieleria marina TaxID=1930275 RepID=A0A517NRA4_9BACT|nr:hypothetical protein K239x_16010 [Planctomycetes bacterium K23_9]